MKMRKITQDDLNAAARGLGMHRYSYYDLTQLMNQYKNDANFAGKVIYLAAKQIRAAKSRVGLIRKNPTSRYSNSLSKQDHEKLARAALHRAREMQKQWNRLIEREHLRVFGRPFEFHDYKISAIGRDEYSESAKNKLRNLAYGSTAQLDQARKHWKAAGHRRMLKINPAPRIGTRHPLRRSQITGRTPTRRLVARRRVNTRAGFFPNPRSMEAAQRETYGVDYMTRSKPSAKQLAARRRFAAMARAGKFRRGRKSRRSPISVPAQFGKLPYIVQCQRNGTWRTEAAFTDAKRAKQYAGKVARFYNAPARVVTR